MNPDATTKALTPERWQRIESLFHAALEMPEAERDDFLRRSCVDDGEMFTEVENLVFAFESEKQFRPVSGTGSFEPAKGRIGETIGGYRLERELGHGGMGTVYLASRVDGEFEQQVALKVVSSHLRTLLFVERFRAERQILANLNHPNITRLLDGGVSSSGDPYLAMEYVDGQPISRYCDERLLDVPARIRLFLEACSAVEYAHRNLVVHRDLKPGNLMVTSAGVPKLLDFGTAKLLLAAPTDRTATGFQAMTPRYASPEQLRGEQVSTSMDVYALGVMLYELVVGAWPFGDPDSALAGFERAVRDVDPAPPRSLITDESARLRSTTKVKLERILDGDLRSILGKAMEAEPLRRYSSVEHFSGDLRRYLNGEAVQARPNTIWYTASKFVKRHKLAVAATVLFVCLLSGATIYSIREAEAARREAAKSALMVQFLQGIFGSADPAAQGGNRNYTVLQVLEQARKRLDVLNPEPEVKAYINYQLGVSFENLSAYDEAEEQFRSALALAPRLSSAEVAWAETGLADVLEAKGKMDEAESLRRDASERAQKIGKNKDPRLFNAAAGKYAYLMWQRYGHSPKVEALAMEAANLARTAPQIPRAWLVMSDFEIAQYLMEENRDAEAMKRLDEALAVERGFEHPTMSLGFVYSTIGLVKQKQGDLVEAEQYQRKYREEMLRQVGPDHPSSIDAEAVWAAALARVGRLLDADGASKDALDRARRRYTAGSANLWSALEARAFVLNEEHHSKQAEALARESLSVLVSKNPKDPQRAASWGEIGVALNREKRFAEAIPPLESSERIYIALPGWGPKHPDTVRVERALALARTSR
ncbi:MAG TPA: serine/threonine-protein kinase [Bryobacteraceae bacterium]|jgi:serine/threonine-protein kinase